MVKGAVLQFAALALLAAASVGLAFENVLQRVRTRIRLSTVDTCKARLLTRISNSLTLLLAPLPRHTTRRHHPRHPPSMPAHRLAHSLALPPAVALAPSADLRQPLLPQTRPLPRHVFVFTDGSDELEATRARNTDWEFRIYNETTGAATSTSFWDHFSEFLTSAPPHTAPVWVGPKVTRSHPS